VIGTTSGRRQVSYIDNKLCLHGERIFGNFC
jgi:hypothetical protein